MVSENEVVNFGDPAENYLRSGVLPEDFVNNPEVQNNVAEYFSSFDVAIWGFAVEEYALEDGKDQGKSYRIDALHKMAGNDKTAPISLKEESSGTLKMFALYPSLREVLDKGYILFVDELNAKQRSILRMPS